MLDDVYAARYREHLREALGGLFAPDAFARRLRELHTLVAAAVTSQPAERSGGISREAFAQSVDGPGGLVEFAKRRHELIRTALDAAAR